MSQNRAILLTSIAAVIAATILIFAGPGSLWLRMIVGVPFVLLLPGHAVMLYIDTEARFGGFEWFALAVGTSIALTTLVGMGLASSAAGLTAAGMVVALLVVVLLTLAAAGTRSASQPPRRQLPTHRGSLQRASYGALGLIVCALVIIAISMSSVGTSRTQVVQLWGLPDSAGDGVRIGATNVDAKSRHYSLVIEQGGRLISRQGLQLPAGAGHVFEVRKSATWTSSAPVSAVLTDLDGAVSPRSVSVWMKQ
jgi:hypothetical protein